MPTQGQLMRYGKKRLIDIILAREAIIKTLERQYNIARDELDRRHEESASTPADYVTASEFAEYSRIMDNRFTALASALASIKGPNITAMRAKVKLARWWQRIW